MAKNWLSSFITTGLGESALGLAERTVRRLEGDQTNRLLVLTYHAVTDAVTFEKHMSFLATNYQPVDIHDVLKAVNGSGPPLPPRALLVTFDDAYRSFGECAWPLMRRYGMPAMVFVPTAFPGATDNVFWWDRLEEAVLTTARRDALDSPAGSLPLQTDAQRRESLKQLKKCLWGMPQTELLAWVHELCGRLGVTESCSRVLGWDQLRRLKQQGVTLAPHSRTHPDMSRLSREEARDEIAGSFEDLQKEIGTVLPIFAYPGGYYNRETLMALAQESFLLAFATLRGTNDLEKVSEGFTRFELRRNHIDAEASLPVLRSRLLYASRFLNQWHARRKQKKGYES